jgi:hypothetical protein
MAWHLAAWRAEIMANTDTVTAFFTFFAHPTIPGVDPLVDTYFSANGSLGISPGSDTQQGPQAGPQFPDPGAVKLVLKQIITSFPHITFQPVPDAATAVYCSSGNTIMVQASFSTGKHQKPWFHFGHSAYSKPLSDIEPDNSQNAFIPACAVFTFSPPPPPPFLINNLAIYMDRWQMAVDLWPGINPGKKPGRHFPTP